KKTHSAADIPKDAYDETDKDIRQAVHKVNGIVEHRSDAVDQSRPSNVVDIISEPSGHSAKAIVDTCKDLPSLPAAGHSNMVGLDYADSVAPGSDKNFPLDLSTQQTYS
ncbi:hypothetical protein LPJ66_009286, partial [Kickxella alabastrina]